MSFLSCFDWISSILARVEDLFLTSPLDRKETIIVCLFVYAFCHLGNLRDLHRSFLLCPNFASLVDLLASSCPIMMSINPLPSK